MDYFGRNMFLLRQDFKTTQPHPRDLEKYLPVEDFSRTARLSSAKLLCESKLLLNSQREFRLSVKKLRKVKSPDETGATKSDVWDIRKYRQTKSPDKNEVGRLISPKKEVVFSKRDLKVDKITPRFRYSMGRSPRPTSYRILKKILQFETAAFPSLYKDKSSKRDDDEPTVDTDIESESMTAVQEPVDNDIAAITKHVAADETFTGMVGTVAEAIIKHCSQREDSDSEPSLNDELERQKIKRDSIKLANYNNFLVRKLESKLRKTRREKYLTNLRLRSAHYSRHLADELKREIEEGARKREMSIKSPPVRNGHHDNHSSSLPGDEIYEDQSYLTSNQNTTTSGLVSNTDLVTTIIAELAKSPDTNENNNAANSIQRKTPSKPRGSIVALQTNTSSPLYYLSGGNNCALVDGPLSRLGWKRTTDKTMEFKLKWTECTSQITYYSFKEGEQMVNHIPNASVMTNKLGLYNSLKEYDRSLTSTRKRYTGMTMRDFYPETYNLDDRNDKYAFMDIYKDGDIWICKPTGLNQGKGIYLIRNLDELRRMLSSREERKNQNLSKRLMGRIIQRYLPMPLLLEKKKFDVRTFMAITSTTPFMVYYQQGYCRLSVHEYSKDSTDMKIHLTNQYIQKKDPTYKDVKDETVWSMERLNDYINQQVAPWKGLGPNWVHNVFVRQTQKIMLHLFKSVKNKLMQKVGFFELYGLDFMVDHDMRIYLIEVNVNPALTTNCEVLVDVIPPVVEECLNVSIESFEKTRKGIAIQPLKSLRNFNLLYSEKATVNGSCSTTGQTITGERRMPQLSPHRQSPLRTGTEPRQYQTNVSSRPTSLPKLVQSRKDNNRNHTTNSDSVNKSSKITSTRISNSAEADSTNKVSASNNAIEEITVALKSTDADDMVDREDEEIVGVKFNDTRGN